MPDLFPVAGLVRGHEPGFLEAQLSIYPGHSLGGQRYPAIGEWKTLGEATGQGKTACGRCSNCGCADGPIISPGHAP
jgi:hypothetical protein